MVAHNWGKVVVVGGGGGGWGSHNWGEGNGGTQLG